MTNVLQKLLHLQQILSMNYGNLLLSYPLDAEK